MSYKKKSHVWLQLERSDGRSLIGRAIWLNSVKKQGQRGTFTITALELRLLNSGSAEMSPPPNNWSRRKCYIAET
jgi:hypothetical protein